MPYGFLYSHGLDKLFTDAGEKFKVVPDWIKEMIG